MLKYLKIITDVINKGFCWVLAFFADIMLRQTVKFWNCLIYIHIYIYIYICSEFIHWALRALWRTLMKTSVQFSKQSPAPGALNTHMCIYIRFFEVAVESWAEWSWTHDHWILFRCSNQLSYQTMSSTCTQNQLDTATPISSFVQC